MHPIPANFQKGWEELIGVSVDPAQSKGLVSGKDEGYNDLNAEVNVFLVEASQWVESELICTSAEEKLQRLN